ncbi:MAG: outer membrane protein assembly factor BamC [Methylococcaceae bacterium]|nr:outer membrane protein assembly factor BamC [Methylococcaceae bacterium]
MKSIMRILIALVVIFLISACGMVKSVFPDKEKDYRFTRELPVLVVPTDLDRTEIAAPPIVAAEASTSRPASTSAVLRPGAVPSTSEANAVPLEQASVAEENAAQEVSEPDAPVLTQLTLRDTPNQPALLQVNQDLQRTWRILGKAMTQEALEIVERNTTAHYFVVQYEPKAKALKDDSIWDNVGFLFGDENNQEQAYRIALTEKAQQTDIRVLDANNKECATEACIQLTRLLKTAMEKSLKE